MEKKNTGLVILVVILSLLVVGLGGYVVYDKVLENDTVENEEKESNNNSDNNNETIQNENNSVSKVLSGNYYGSATTIVVYNDEVYISFDPCTSLTDKNEYCSSIDNITSEYKEYTFGNFEYETIGIVQSYRYKNPLNPNFLGIKLNISDVKSIYTVMQGQGISPNEQGFALIKNDGSVSVISFQDIVNNNLTPKTTELKNITKVENKIGDDGTYTFAIDNFSKEHSIYDYFK